MWSLYVLLTKILKAEEEEQEQQNQEEEDEEERRKAHGSCEDDLNMIGSLAYDHLSLDRKYHMAVLPRAHYTDVPHVNQLASWDCGLACILMVLRTNGISTCNINTLADMCGTNSIWTVDLAYLLQKFSVNFSYYTITFGANPDYSNETFYKHPEGPLLLRYTTEKLTSRLHMVQEQLTTDVERVDKLFCNALASGISIQCRSISDEEISLLILSGEYIAITLVDQYKLSIRSWLEDVCISSSGGHTTNYTGHYIIICGYDADKDEFEIRDPASSRKREKVSSKCLGEARRSFGTDEDLLLISVDKSKSGIRSSV